MKSYECKQIAIIIKKIIIWKHKIIYKLLVLDNIIEICYSEVNADDIF